MELESPLLLSSCHSLYQGTATTYKTTWPHIEGLQLADPQFSAADPIEMLLGAEVCSIILQEGLRKGDPLSILCSDGFSREAAARISQRLHTALSSAPPITS